MPKRPTNPTIEGIKQRALARLDRAKAVDGLTYEAIAGKAGTVRNHIYDLHKREKPVTLNMAFKIWEGLGEKLSELVGTEPDPFWQRLGTMDREQRELILKVMDLLDIEGKATGVKSLIDYINNLHDEFYPKDTSAPSKP